MPRRIFSLFVIVLASTPTFAQTKLPPTPPDGILPVGADGKPLNLDFETGTLKDWTAEGEAFEGQPIKGDTVYPRHNGSRSQHQGNYWIGTYERKGDKPQGTLTSMPFKVTHPWASFLVAGGPHEVTCVELIRKDTGKVVHRATGFAEENLRREVVDLQPHQGKEIFIRLVDKHSGDWGHINFDDFRFHSTKPNYPKRPSAQAQIPLDQYKFAGIPPAKAAAVMTVPEGFEVKLFAGEPDIVQPIAMCLDDRGRVWVVESFCYPQRRKPKGPDSPFVADGIQGDRILIFEDEKGDGHFTKRTVFMEGLNLVSGIEVGFGGVWIGAAPYLLYVPMKDDKHAGEPKILLDGWGYQDTHETLNAFIWGPDGWLYGCHGVFTHSKVGKPGTPDDNRTRINAGIWRYHPTRHVFEVFAEGTSNPWGLDFNEYGQAFCEACVIPHCFHLIQGARYHRQAGNHFNPYTFADIQTIADHLHWQGPNQWAAANRSDAFGGGHAHCGLMCYLGGAWPAEYRGQLFMGNIHGRRLNLDTLKPKGSGYVASHGNDFLLANDAWARFINMRYGPDGNVYLIDWYDKQACHSTDIKIWDRDNGRIYKICYRGTKPVQVDLSKKSDKELVELQLHENDWYVRHARRLLQERGKLASGDLVKILSTHADPTRRLRALWTLFACRGDVSNEPILAALDDASEHVRAWTIRLMWQDGLIPERFNKKVLQMAREGDSPVVRLAIASALQRIPTNDRWEYLAALVSHSEDANDLNLPLMYWYAMEPLGGEDPARALDLAAKSKMPMHLQFMVRRLAAVQTMRIYVDPEKMVARNLTAGDIVAALQAQNVHVPSAQKNRPPAPARQPIAYTVTPMGRLTQPEQIGDIIVKTSDAGLVVYLRDIARVEMGESPLGLLVEGVEKAGNAPAQLAFLEGIRAALKGQRQVPMPKAWPGAFAKLSKSNESRVREQALSLAVVFGDPSAFAEMRRQLVTSELHVAQRKDALDSLLGAKDKELVPLLHKLIADPDLRSPALRGLAIYDDPRTPEVILQGFANFTTQEKRDALNTLGARLPYAKAMLDAVAAKKIPAGDVSADIVRQMRNLKDKELEARIAEVWGIVRDTPADRAKEIARHRKLLLTPAPPPDLALGRALYQKTCANCHTLFGLGAKVGPDITGANRQSIDYLLENIFDPSAVIPKEYAATVIELNDGRVLTGIVKDESKVKLTMVTANEALTIPVAEIALKKPSDKSMMPDDQMVPFKDHEFRALIAYLQSPNQTPILATEENAKDLFNGKDLTGWDGDMSLWRVENSEIVGLTKGLKKNEFLRSQMIADDFRLTLKVKLVPNAENSGVQFRSQALPDGDIKGPQADIGLGWWGKLYEEHGRGILFPLAPKEGKGKGVGFDGYVNKDKWNDYEIVAVGSKIKTYVNGKVCVDLDDPQISRRGLFAFQLHSGGPMEVRFKDIQLEVTPKGR
ncbi:MAG: DUF1080 domain-containing protein [Planctomycetes bacterium]|nr:DUF1080 domain-containing protein [Planctomycetota bacterium]